MFINAGSGVLRLQGKKKGKKKKKKKKKGKKKALLWCGQDTNIYCQNSWYFSLINNVAFDVFSKRIIY